MEREPRKASEIILALENKIDILLGIVRSLDLNIKILSNKLNQLSERQEPKAPKITMEAVHMATPTVPFQSTFQPNPERDVLIDPASNLVMEEVPKGFRRTSRPETFSGDNAYLTRSAVPQPKAEVIVPSKNIASPLPKEANVIASPSHVIPTTQRVVNRDGKSIYLADVEITNLETKQVQRYRTNGTGKWSATLQIGTYRVLIKKQDTASKERLEAVQDISIDGGTSPLELNTLIIK